MAQQGGRGAKRSRTDGNDSSQSRRTDAVASGSGDAEDDEYVKLCPELQTRMGGQRYVKEDTLTRVVLLDHLKAKGDVAVVTLVRVKVQEMGGRTFGITLDHKSSTVSALKSAIQEREGFPVWSQQLFRFGAGGGAEGASESPLEGSVAVVDENHFALCVQSAPDWKWNTKCEEFHQYKLSGHENLSIERLQGPGDYDDDGDYDHIISIAPIMEGSGIYTISFALVKTDGVATTFGLTLSAASEIKYGFVFSEGIFDRYADITYCNGDEMIGNKLGEVLTMCFDLSAGTLKTWCGEEPAAVIRNIPPTNKYVWALTAGWTDEALRIVPDTPKLKPWPVDEEDVDELE